MPDSASSSVLWLQVTILLLQRLHDGLLEGLEIDRPQTAAAAAAMCVCVLCGARGWMCNRD